MATLTRDEAERRAATIEVERYGIALDLTGPGDTFDSTTTIAFTATADRTFVELLCEELVSVTLDGAALPTTVHADGRLELAGLGGRHELVVVARIRYSHDGEGLHRFVDPADAATYLCATSSVDNAKRWFACFDQPDLKAVVELTVRCPQDWTVVANGAATALGEGRWQLAPTRPISTYLVTLVAGPWHSVLGSHDGIPLGLHVRRSLAAELDRDAPALLQLTADALDAFHELFGVRYPFGEYHQAFVPEFNWGAMENPGCVTFRDQMIFRSAPSEEELVGRATTIVHEMAHMWFGDLVTMRWWDDLWLNESFAEYLAHRVTTAITDMPAWQDFAASRKAWGYGADRHATTHPVAGNGARDARAALDDFDGISYAKGAAVLRQLASYLGDDMFMAGLRDHVRHHAFGNAAFADLVAAWAAHAGPGTPTADDLERWTTQWLRTPGVDVVGVDPAAGAAAAAGTVLHRSPPVYGPPARRPHAMTVAVLGAGAAATRWRQPVVLDADEVVLDVPALGEDEILLPNAGDESWATVRLAPAHWQRLPAVLAASTDGVARTVVWNAVRTALADGLVTPELAVRTVAAGLAREIDVVLVPVLRWITAAIPLYVAPGPARDAASAVLTEAVGALLRSAGPGSPRQLVAARAWIAVTGDVEVLRAWTDGRPDVPGIVVDAELRWAAHERRAALGDLDPAGIEAAYEADRSASGLVHATRCRALRPDPAAKAEAWAALTDPAGTLSQYQLTALAGGIWVAGQEQLAAPYASRWFEDMPATLAFRSGWALSSVAQACFPLLSVDAATLERAESLAARADVVTGLRRIASDGADDLRRALAVRAASRSGT